MILGANGIGKVALDIFNSNGVVVYCFLDDAKDLQNTEINSISVLGATDDDGFLKLIGKKVEAFVASDEVSVRKSLVEMLNEKRKVMPVNAIHSDAVISNDASIGHGNFVNMGVKVGANSNIGSHNLLNSGSIVEFDSKIGDFVQIGAGSIVGSGCEIEDEVFVGSGVTIVSGVKIGKNARVGAGSVVIENVKKGETVFGNPAQKLSK